MSKIAKTVFNVIVFTASVFLTAAFMYALWLLLAIVFFN